ncbi:acetylxylan esterase [Brachybacterium sp. DNPG3]
MALFDMPLAQLRDHRPALDEPDDLDAFWDETLADARRHPVLISAEPVADGMTLIDTWDVTFAGHGGDPIRAWYHRPAGAAGPLPVVVEYIGYGGGRGEPHERILWPAAGYAHLLMDSRGQGAMHAPGDTPDPHGSGPSAPGVMTRGIESPRTAYLTRLLTDAARAIDAARALPGADGRVVAAGNSQGGGLAIAAASLVPDVDALLTTVPFLAHIRRAIDLVDTEPYQEIVRFLAVHRGREEEVLRTLSYVDVMHLGRRATAPAHFAVGLRDTTCPPSTVFAAYNRYGELARESADAHLADRSHDREIEVYPFNGHEGGGARHQRRQLAWLAERVPLAPAP